VPEIMSDEEWALRLVQGDGVLVQPGYFFDLHLGATLVVSLLTPPATFDHGIARILAAVNGPP
jgi:aspartate/methionine/tyrosine aminotransferase